MRGAYQLRFLFARRIKEWLGIAERAIRIDHKSRHESDSLKLEWKAVRRRWARGESRVNPKNEQSCRTQCLRFFRRIISPA